MEVPLAIFINLLIKRTNRKKNRPAHNVVRPVTKWTFDCIVAAGTIYLGWNSGNITLSARKTAGSKGGSCKG